MQIGWKGETHVRKHHLHTKEELLTSHLPHHAWYTSSLSPSNKREEKKKRNVNTFHKEQRKEMDQLDSNRHHGRGGIKQHGHWWSRLTWKEHATHGAWTESPRGNEWWWRPLTGAKRVKRQREEHWDKGQKAIQWHSPNNVCAMVGVVFLSKGNGQGLWRGNKTQKRNGSQRMFFFSFLF